MYWWQVAIKLAPDRKKFLEVLGGADAVKADLEKFLAIFTPILQENHKFLVRFIGNNYLDVSFGVMK